LVITAPPRSSFVVFPVWVSTRNRKPVADWTMISALLSGVREIPLALLTSGTCILAWAGSSLHHELVRAASAAATLSALHLGYHTAHLKGFTTGQTAVQTAGLVAALVLPAVAYTLAGSSMSAQQATDARGRSPGGGRSM
jgi:hypothetical protein